MFTSCRDDCEVRSCNPIPSYLIGTTMAKPRNGSSLVELVAVSEAADSDLPHLLGSGFATCMMLIRNPSALALQVATVVAACFMFVLN